MRYPRYPKDLPRFLDDDDSAAAEYNWERRQAEKEERLTDEDYLPPEIWDNED